MKLKFNESKDGVSRATMMINQRISRHDLIRVTAYLIERKEKITKKNIESELRDFLRSTGSDYYELFAIQNALDDYEEEAQEWIEKIYPELT